MSRIGNKEIIINKDLQVAFTDGLLQIKGPKGELSRAISSDLVLDISEEKILVKRETDISRVKALHGLTRSLINNMIIGVTEGFEKILEKLNITHNIKEISKTYKCWESQRSVRRFFLVSYFNNSSNMTVLVFPDLFSQFIV